MQLNVIDISYELEDEEGLSYLFFKAEDGYFTISRLVEDEKLYMELNNQSNGEYIDPIYFEYSVRNGKIMFYVNENRTWNLGIYQNITLLFEPISLDVFREIGQVIKKIFKT